MNKGLAMIVSAAAAAGLMYLDDPASLFGEDPKSQMDEDLVRMKTFIETGKAPSDAAGRSA